MRWFGIWVSVALSLIILSSAMPARAAQTVQSSVGVARPQNVMRPSCYGAPQPQYGIYAATDPAGYLTVHVQYYWCPRWAGDPVGLNFARGWATTTARHSGAEIWVDYGAGIGRGAMLIRGADWSGTDGVVVFDGVNNTANFLIGGTGTSTDVDYTLPANGAYRYKALYAVEYAIRDEATGFVVTMATLTVMCAHYV